MTREDRFIGFALIGIAAGAVVIAAATIAGIIYAATHK